MKKLLRHQICLAALAGAFALSAHGQTVYVNDDFEESWYVSDFESLNWLGGWSWNNADLLEVLTQDPDGTPNQSIRVMSGGNLIHMLDNAPPPSPSDSAPIVFSFRMFDPMTTNDETGALLGGRMFGVIRPEAAANFVAAGLHNSVDTGTYDVTRYQARVMGGGNWIQLAAERSYGWQEFKIVVHHDTVDIYVNGQLDPNGTSRPRAAGAVIDRVWLGGALTSSTEGYFDNAYLAVDAGAARAITITQHPAPLTVAVGDEAVFTVVASANGTLAYEWQKDGVQLFDGSGISGVETDTLTIASAVLDDTGYYRVALSSGGATEYTSAALLTVHPFLFTQQPVSQVVQFGDSGVFTVEVHGEGPFTYQWQKDGEDLEDDGRISGAETDTLTVGSVQEADSGSYRVVVTNPHGERTSNAVALSGGPPPTGVRFADFEEFDAPTTSGTVMFRQPSYSGSNRGLLATPNTTQVVSTFPAGTWGARVLRVNFAFNPDYTAEEHWLRLTTHLVTNLGNPIIGFDRYLRFEMYTNEDVYVTLGVRETQSTGEYGEDGGVANGIEWLGGSEDDPAPPETPQKGILVKANSWQTVVFDLPNEFVKPFAGGTANGVLEGTKGTLEHLAIRPARREDNTIASVHEIFLDNFEVTEVKPEPPVEPGVAPVVNITRGAGADVELVIVGAPSTSYVVEASDDLVNWSTLGTASTNSEGVADFLDANATNTFSRRFYRVSEE